jgi:hypothetical protein
MALPVWAAPVNYEIRAQAGASSLLASYDPLMGCFPTSCLLIDQHDFGSSDTSVTGRDEAGWAAIALGADATAFGEYSNAEKSAPKLGIFGSPDESFSVPNPINFGPADLAYYNHQATTLVQFSDVITFKSCLPDDFHVGNLAFGYN